MDWFRLYGEFATDPKVQMLSEADQRRFIMVLCLRCSNGDVTLHDEEVAFQLRIGNDEWSRTKGALQAKGLVTDDNQPTAWDRRQYQSDSSAARVRRHREAKKRACNVTATPPEADTEADTDTEEPKSLRPREQVAIDATAQRKTSGTPKRASQLPDRFEPDETATALAAELQVSLPAELPKFRDYHAARGKPMKDWQAALRTWLRNAKAFSSSRPSSGTSPPYLNREDARRIAASTRLSDFRAACAADQQGQRNDDDRTIEATATARLVGGADL